MSIYRQLWLAVISLMLLAFAGSFVVSIITARGYIEQQLYMKNVDNAAALGLVLSQLPEKDPVTIELLISAQFDTGHYQRIVLSNPRHEILLERHYTGNAGGAPDWFVSLLPLKTRPGTALVQDGWKQFGSIEVVSHNRFAYRELWNGALWLATWFVLAGLTAGVVGTILLRVVFRPLKRVVDQAQAIHERRFITVAEPSTPELRTVVVAMNDMVERLKLMFAEEAGRLEELRRQVNHDAMTDLPNRGFFMTWLNETLDSQESAGAGSLALVRIHDLEGMNARLGRSQVDQIIKDISLALKGLTGQSENRLTARLNGSDFAVLAVGDGAAIHLAEEVHGALLVGVAQRWPQVPEIFHVGAVPYQRGEAPGTLLGSADKALAIAQNKGPNACYGIEGTAEAQQTLPSEVWHQALSGALAENRIRLESYPVLSASGHFLHLEHLARLQVEQDGAWLPAGEFMPIALRLNLSTTVDLAVVSMALKMLSRIDMDIAVNLSAESIADWGFREDFVAMLLASPEKLSHLWIEVPEYGAFRQFDAFRSLCHNLDPLGCKLGIEHFGQHFGEITRLAELGLDYLKVDSSYVRDIDHNSGNQEFLRGLCKMAHNVGLLVVAEGVQSEAEFTTLTQLGFDGATGQEVTRRIQQIV